MHVKKDFVISAQAGIQMELKPSEFNHVIRGGEFPLQKPKKNSLLILNPRSSASERFLILKPNLPEV